MTNAEKFKTAKERIETFNAVCNYNKCEICPIRSGKGEDPIQCFAHWLDLQFTDGIKIEKCPYCGSECYVMSHSEGHEVRCSQRHCYVGKTFESKIDAITAHNKLCKRHDKMLDDMLWVCHQRCPDNNGYEPKCEKCKCKLLCDKYHALQLEISEFREKVERGMVV